MPTFQIIINFIIIACCIACVITKRVHNGKTILIYLANIMYTLLFAVVYFYQRNKRNEFKRKIEDHDKFYESFPLKVKSGYIIYSISLIEKRMFYDTDWVISGSYEIGLLYNPQYFCKKLVRRDNETRENLLNLIKSTSCPDEIDALDECEKIYYD